MDALSVQGLALHVEVGVALLGLLLDGGMQLPLRFGDDFRRDVGIFDTGRAFTLCERLSNDLVDLVLGRRLYHICLVDLLLQLRDLVHLSRIFYAATVFGDKLRPLGGRTSALVGVR
jgi:hypothetical protein